MDLGPNHFERGGGGKRDKTWGYETGSKEEGGNRKEVEKKGLYFKVCSTKNVC